MEWLYINNADNSCRYVLGTVGVNPLICVGVNPSTAEPNNLDKTLDSVKRISTNNSYDSWIMINLYPQRATNPNDMSQVANEKLIVENIKYIEQLLSQYPHSDIWAAWGTLITKRAYLKDCFFKINTAVLNSTSKWVHFGTKSKQGHPHHPLYLKASVQKELFDAVAYGKSL